YHSSSLYTSTRLHTFSSVHLCSFFFLLFPRPPSSTLFPYTTLFRSLIMFQTFISRHNSNFFSDKLVLTSVTPASSAPVYQKKSRSEERFSRNAETDIVCRLLLEKKKLSTTS